MRLDVRLDGDEEEALRREYRELDLETLLDRLREQLDRAEGEKVE